MTNPISDNITRTSIKVISNLPTVKFEINDALNKNELNELNNYPEKHYKLFAGFVKTLDPIFIFLFSNNSDPTTETALKKYQNQQGKLIKFLTDSDFVCSSLSQENEKNIVNIKDDYSQPDTLIKYRDLLKFADLVFCDDNDPERIKLLVKNLKSLQYLRNPLLIINNIDNNQISELRETFDIKGMSLSSFSSEKGTALFELKHQKTSPLELNENERFKKLHLGCGSQKIDGFINVDVRPTAATDLVHSCVEFEDFPDEYFDTIYSHAFFEHLNIQDELRCLRNIKNLLTDDGIVLFLGIPDFELIAKSYLEGTKGFVSEKFDLLQVYRYTHGAPEQGGEDWWYEQFHKSVFDTKRLKDLLDMSGYNHYIIFRYCFRDENIPLNLGFAAWNYKETAETQTHTILIKIPEFTEDIKISSVEVLLTQ